MRGNTRTDTRPEVAVRSAAHRLGLRFRKNIRLQVDGLSVRPDIVFPSRRIAVFIDGCFWHGCPEHGNVPTANSSYWGPKLERNRRRDRLVDERLDLAGWGVLRIWEHVEPEDAAGIIAAAVRT